MKKYQNIILNNGQEIILEIEHIEQGIKTLTDKVKEKIFNNKSDSIEFKNSVRKITSTYYLMKDKFSKKYRDSGERYFEHLRGVANIVLDLPNPNVNKVLIALSHDAIEDVEIPFEVLKYLTNQEVAIATKAISKLPWQDYSNNKEIGKKLRNQEYFEHLSSFESMKKYIDEIINEGIVKIKKDQWGESQIILENTIKLTEDEVKKITLDVFDVKFADRIHNLSTQWDPNNIEKVKRKIHETKTYFLDIAKKLNPEAYKKLNTEIFNLEQKLENTNSKIEKIIQKT